MIAKSLLLGALSASYVQGANVFEPRAELSRCGSREPSAAHQAISAALAQEEGNTVEALTTTDVDVYFHIVAASTKPEDGYIPAAQIDAQLKVLEDTFAPSGFTWNYKGAEWTINETWAVDGDELAMKKALRKGTYRTLNVYFQKEIGGNLGYCYFPDTITPGSDEFYLDGCSILYSSVPGGSATNFNEGKTVTHEVGHWFGLYHTFQGGCDTEGDEVADTPAQASPTSGCPIGRDSCPNKKGLDPIHNYMDYSYDSCYEEFTKGQKRRMKSFWRHFRTAQSP